MPLYNPALEDIATTYKFIEELQNAVLSSDENAIEPLNEDLLRSINNPATHELEELSPDQRYSIDTFLAIGNASQ